MLICTNTITCKKDNSFFKKTVVKNKSNFIPSYIILSMFKVLYNKDVLILQWLKVMWTVLERKVA